MTSISTLAFNSQTRVALTRLQTELNDLTVQVANDGRYSDVGRTLGRLTGSSVSARALSDSLKEQQTSNNIIDRRLQTAEAGMKTIKDNAEDVANDLIGVSVGREWSVFVSQAKTGLAATTTALNSASAGTYVFGGIKSDTKPIADYDNSAAKTAATANFEAFVLAATGGTDVSAVTAGQMTAYLGTGYTDAGNVTHSYSDLFGDTSWKANWSSASSDAGQSRISGTETAASAVSANSTAFRTVTSGYTMLMDLDIAKLGTEARTVVLNASAAALRGGSAAITTIGAEVGTTRARITTANAELLRQQDILSATVDTLENEDITVLGLRASALETNLNAAYAVTAKIQNLSILDYL